MKRQVTKLIDRKKLDGYRQIETRWIDRQKLNGQIGNQMDRQMEADLYFQSN